MEALDFIKVMDGIMILAYKITQEQLNLLFDEASDDELSTLVGVLTVDENKATFTQKRKGLEIKHKYLK